MSLFKNLSNEALLKEWWLWENKVKRATGWAVALSAADEFRKSCEQEIIRRNTLLNKKENQDV